MKKRTIVAISILAFLGANYSLANEYSQQDVQRYSAYYSNGMQYMKDGQYRSAINEFRKVLRFSPYDSTTQEALANAYFTMAQYYRTTTKEIKKALVNYKSAYFYAKYWNKSDNPNLNALANNCSKIIGELEKRLNQGQTTQSRLQNAKILKAQGELAAAGYDFQLLKQGEFKEVSYENLGNIYKNLNNIALGMDYIKTAIDLNPKNPKYHFAYGVMLDEAKNYEASMEQYNLALQYGDKSPELLEILESKWTQNVVNAPADSHGYINLGAIYQKQGNLEAARAQYQKAYQLNPDDEVVMYNLASLFVQQKNYQGALSIYNNLLLKNPNKIDVLEYKATALKELMRYEEAIEVYEKIVSLNPNNAFAKSEIENITMNNYSGDKLINYLALKATNNPKSYEAQFNYALELHKNKLNPTALSYYKKALEIDPTKEEVYLNLAQIYIEEKKYAEANDICQKGLIMLPKSEKLKNYVLDIKTYSAGSQYELATQLYEQKEYRRALAEYLKIQKKTPEVQMAIASCYWQLLDYQNANKYYQEVLKSAPNTIEALLNSAYAYYSMNDYENAKIMAKKLLALDKTNKTATELINSITETETSNQLQEAIANYEQGQYGKSYELIEKYLSKKPNNEYAQYYRALNLEEMNKLQDAVKQYRSLISKKPTFAPAYYSLAVILDNAENYREAVANYDKFISIKGNDKDEMTEFAISRAKELKEYLNQINASK